MSATAPDELGSVTLPQTTLSQWQLEVYRGKVLRISSEQSDRRLRWRRDRALRGEAATEELERAHLARARVEIGAEFGGRLAENAFEHAIELGQRLEPDVVSDLADPPARI